MKAQKRKKLIQELAGFVETYHGLKLSPNQKLLFKAIGSGKRVYLARPNHRMRLLHTLNEQLVLGPTVPRPKTQLKIWSDEFYDPDSMKRVAEGIAAAGAKMQKALPSVQEAAESARRFSQAIANEEAL